MLAGPCQHEVRHGSALEARSTVSPVRQGKTISRDALSESKSDSPPRQSSSSPPSRTNSSIQPRSLCDLTTEQTGVVRTRILLSPDRSRKTLANVLMVREPGFAESKLHPWIFARCFTLRAHGPGGQGRSMWKARPIKTRSSSPSVGERYCIQKLHDDLFCDQYHTGGTATRRTIKGHNDVRIVET